MQCPPGTYSLGGAATCTECGDNEACEHRDTQTSVRDGFFSPQGTGIALVCPAGWYCKHENLATGVSATVAPCAHGYWSEAGSSTCTICPAGGHCPQTDQMHFSCPEGFIQASAGKQYCTTCPAGQYALNSTYCSTVSASQEVFLPHLTPTNCSAGSYSTATTIANTGLVGCQLCDAGNLCPNAAMNSSGLFWNGTSAANEQLLCPEGFMCNIQDEFSARYALQACPAGKTPKTTGADQTTEDGTCEDCPAGSYCRACDLKEDCTSSFWRLTCPAGHYCP